LFLDSDKDIIPIGKAVFIIFIVVLGFGGLLGGIFYYASGMLDAVPALQTARQAPAQASLDALADEAAIDAALEAEAMLYAEAEAEALPEGMPATLDAPAEAPPEPAVPTLSSALPPFDIIIQAGQSNSLGGGLGEVAEPYQVNESIWYFNSDFTFCEAREGTYRGETVGNFSLTFAEEYINNGLLEDGRKLLIVRAAEGGSGFSDCRWGIDDDLQLRMIGMIAAVKDLNPDNRLVAFLWHQGETDAVYEATQDEHYINLLTLVHKVRTTFGEDRLPFVAGDFVYQWKAQNPDISEPVIAAIRQVCDHLGHAMFVETDGLLSNDETVGDGNTSHFSREALYVMGKRYFEAYVGIMGDGIGG
jgi:hypothetical protein